MRDGLDNDRSRQEVSVVQDGVIGAHWRDWGRHFASFVERVMSAHCITLAEEEMAGIVAEIDSNDIEHESQSLWNPVVKSNSG